MQQEHDELRMRMTKMMGRIQSKMQGAEETHYRRMLRNNEEGEIALENAASAAKMEAAAEKERMRQMALEAEAARLNAERQAEENRIKSHVATMDAVRAAEWIAEYHEEKRLEAVVQASESRLSHRNDETKAVLKAREDRWVEEYEEERRIEAEKRERQELYNQKEMAVIAGEEAAARGPIQSEEAEAYEAFVSACSDEYTNAVARVRARVFATLDDDTQEKVSEMSQAEGHRFLDELEEIRLLKSRLKRHTSARGKRPTSAKMSSM